MSHEFSVFMLIAAALLLVAAVCGVVFYGVAQSRDIADDGLNNLNDAAYLTDVISAIRQNGNMPATACYRLLKENADLIVRLDCRICGRTTVGAEVGDCIKDHMSGRVLLTLTEEESGGTYTAVLTGG
jgi:hypothetical protein